MKSESLIIEKSLSVKKNEVIFSILYRLKKSHEVEFPFSFVLILGV